MARSKVVTVQEVDVAQRTTLSPEESACLRGKLIQCFDEEELRTLCSDLGVDYDSLPARGKEAHARELVAYFERRGEISALVRILSKRRHHIDWEETTHVAPPELPPKVFISCTQEDLQPEYETVRRVVEELRFEVTPAETYPQLLADPRDTVSRKVERCHIVIEILGGHYGTIPASESLSFADIECEAADRLGKHILCYLKKLESREPKQQEFVNRQLRSREVRHFANLNELVEQVKEDLLNFARGRPIEARSSEMPTSLRIVLVEDEDLEPLMNGLREKLPQAQVNGFNNGSQAVEYARRVDPPPHIVVLDSKIPWLSFDCGTEGKPDHDNSVKTAREIQKIANKSLYCGGIYLCAYSAFQGDVPGKLRKWIRPPLLTKNHPADLLNDIVERHVSRFLKRADTRLNWVAKLTEEFTSTYGKEAPRAQSDVKDFIIRITPDFDVSLLHDYLFESWCYLAEGEPCDIDTLQLWEFRNKALSGSGGRKYLQSHVRSRRVEVVAKPPRPQLDESPEKRFVAERAYALLIGVGDYIHPPFVNLPATVRDVQELAIILTDRTRCGYPHGNVRVLAGEQANVGNIRSELKSLAQRSNAHTVFVYFSGHGGRARQENGAWQTYLCPREADLSDLAKTAISGDEFSKLLAEIQAPRLLVMLDACYAAGSAELKAADGAVAWKAGLPDTYYEALSQGSGRVIIASSKEDQLSCIRPQRDLSLFTYHLLQALSGQAAVRGDGLIYVLDVFHYVNEAVHHDEPRQTPFLKVKVDLDFAVALAPA